MPACGGDEDDVAEPAATSAAPGATLGAADAKQIRRVVLVVATNREPCAHLTERYKKEFVFEGVTSEDADEACRQAEEGQPELRNSDVRITAVEGRGDGADVTFTIAGVEQRAELVREKGRWLIDRIDV